MDNLFKSDLRLGVVAFILVMEFVSSTLFAYFFSNTSK